MIGGRDSKHSAPLVPDQGQLCGVTCPVFQRYPMGLSSSILLETCHDSTPWQAPFSYHLSSPLPTFFSLKEGPNGSLSHISLTQSFASGISNLRLRATLFCEQHHHLSHCPSQNPCKQPGPIVSLTPTSNLPKSLGSSPSMSLESSLT